MSYHVIIYLKWKHYHAIMFTLNGNIIGGIPPSPRGVIPYGSTIGCSIEDKGGAVHVIQSMAIWVWLCCFILMFIPLLFLISACLKYEVDCCQYCKNVCVEKSGKCLAV